MDPFLREARLELQCVYYPLGFPLQLKTNSPDVQKACEEIWGGRKQEFDEAPLDLRVIVTPGGSRPGDPAYRAQAHLMSIVSDAENHAVCDYKRRFSYCHLNGGAAADRRFVSYYFLEALANYSLTQLHLTPVHGACVAREGRGMLLCGPSGAGKTSLAYFCARRGWTYISDNESWLVRPAGTQVVGDPRRFRFREDARQLFPELNGKVAAPHANGKFSIELEPANLGVIATAGQCRIERVVFLSRQPDGPAALRPVEPRQASEQLLSEIPIYEEQVRREQQESLERLAALEPVELRYSRLEDACEQAEALLG